MWQKRVGVFPGMSSLDHDFSITLKNSTVTLLIVPLKEELNCLLNVFMSFGWEFHRVQRQGFWFWCFPGKSLVLAVGGYGQNRFETATHFCIQHLGPIKNIFCLGSAGALQSGLKPKNIICATQVIKYNSHQDMSSSFVVCETSEDILEILGMKAKNHSLYFGPVVSVDAEVTDFDSRSRIQRDTGGLAVACEGAGGGRAAQLHGLPFTEIRAVTDQAMENVHLDFKKNLKGAMEKLGELIVDIFN